MSGVEKVFLLSSPHRDAVQWHRNAIDAAAAAGVGLLVRSSIIGADADSRAEFIDAHTQCDRYLERSGVPYAILRSNLFLQNIPESTIPSIDEDGRFYVDAGDARVIMVDTRDIAAVASVVLTERGRGVVRRRADRSVPGLPPLRDRRLCLGRDRSCRKSHRQPTALARRTALRAAPHGRIRRRP
jgi:uncharacterized protein YbjT (DUF2867 family)